MKPLDDVYADTRENDLRFGDFGDLVHRARHRPECARSWLAAWQLWSLPIGVRALLLAVELAAVCLLTVDIVLGGVPRDLSAWLIAGTLVILSGFHAEISLRAERLRRRIAETRYVDLSSVWTFAGALLLPPMLAAATVIASYTHLYFRVFRPAGTPRIDSSTRRRRSSWPSTWFPRSD